MNTYHRAKHGTHTPAAISKKMLVSDKTYQTKPTMAVYRGFSLGVVKSAMYVKHPTYIPEPCVLLKY